MTHSQATAFFEMWTKKEAWLKALGVGIGGGLRSLDCGDAGDAAATFEDALIPEAVGRWIVSGPLHPTSETCVRALPQTCRATGLPLCLPCLRRPEDGATGERHLYTICSMRGLPLDGYSAAVAVPRGAPLCLESLSAVGWPHLLRRARKPPGAPGVRPGASGSSPR